MPLVRITRYYNALNDIRCWRRNLAPARRSCSCSSLRSYTNAMAMMCVSGELRAPFHIGRGFSTGSIVFHNGLENIFRCVDRWTELESCTTHRSEGERYHWGQGGICRWCHFVDIGCRASVSQPQCKRFKNSLLTKWFMHIMSRCKNCMYIILGGDRKYQRWHQMTLCPWN